MTTHVSISCAACILISTQALARPAHTDLTFGMDVAQGFMIGAGHRFASGFRLEAEVIPGGTRKVGTLGLGFAPALIETTEHRLEVPLLGRVGLTTLSDCVTCDPADVGPVFAALTGLDWRVSSAGSPVGFLTSLRGGVGLLAEGEDAQVGWLARFGVGLSF